MDSIDQLMEPREQVDAHEKPAISISRSRDNRIKAVHSSRSYLTTIAVELDKIYPIRGRKSNGKRYVTIGDVNLNEYEI